jgi:hypothetical protein
LLENFSVDWLCVEGLLHLGSGPLRPGVQPGVRVKTNIL